MENAIVLASYFDDFIKVFPEYKDNDELAEIAFFMEDNAVFYHSESSVTDGYMHDDDVDSALLARYRHEDNPNVGLFVSFLDYVEREGNRPVSLVFPQVKPLSGDERTALDASGLMASFSDFYMDKVNELSALKKNYPDIIPADMPLDVYMDESCFFSAAVEEFLKEMTDDSRTATLLVRDLKTNPAAPQKVGLTFNANENEWNSMMSTAASVDAEAHSVLNEQRRRIEGKIKTMHTETVRRLNGMNMKPKLQDIGDILFRAMKGSRSVKDASACLEILEESGYNVKKVEMPYVLSMKRPFSFPVAKENDPFLLKVKYLRFLPSEGTDFRFIARGVSAKDGHAASVYCDGRRLFCGDIKVSFPGPDTDVDTTRMEQFDLPEAFVQNSIHSALKKETASIAGAFNVSQTEALKIAMALHCAGVSVKPGNRISKGYEIFPTSDGNVSIKTADNEWFKFNSLSDPSEGIRIAKRLDGKYDYISPSGRPLTSVPMDTAEPFKDGFADCSIGNALLKIDRDGVLKQKMLIVKNERNINKGKGNTKLS